jgi:hypothetical protein
MNEPPPPLWNWSAHGRKWAWVGDSALNRGRATVFSEIG